MNQMVFKRPPGGLWIHMSCFLQVGLMTQILINSWNGRYWYKFFWGL